MKPDRIRALRTQLTILLEKVKTRADLQLKKHPDIKASHAASAKNLVCYETLRQQDLVSVQKKMAQLGLSRFARSEGHILRALYLAIYILDKLLEKPAKKSYRKQLTESKAEKILTGNTQQLLGKKPKTKRVRIMVTMPDDSAHDPNFAGQLLAAGMDCARINCAHNQPEEWLKMIQNLREQSSLLNKDMKIAMDLAGPKIRTGMMLVPGNTELTKSIMLHTGDHLLICGEAFQSESQSEVTQIACTLPELVRQVKKGEKIHFDDGKIDGIIEQVFADSFEVRVTRCHTDGAKLKVDKGINLPDSNLQISGLTPKDISDLEVIVAHADIINLSFVNDPSDLEMLYRELKRLNASPSLGVIIKLETKKAFNKLPELLLTAMKQSHPFGVMIARGDLALEVGWQNIAYVQSEIIRICNAAHVPIIWATQVLDTLAKSGVPSRSEMTDIFQALKCEAVMLNKGPYILESLRLLNEVLQKDEHFQHKNATMLPSLHPLD